MSFKIGDIVRGKPGQYYGGIFVIDAIQECQCENGRVDIMLCFKEDPYSWVNAYGFEFVVPPILSDQQDWEDEL